MTLTDAPRPLGTRATPMAVTRWLHRWASSTTGSSEALAARERLLVRQRERSEDAGAVAHETAR